MADGRLLEALADTRGCKIKGEHGFHGSTRECSVGGRLLTS